VTLLAAPVVHGWRSPQGNVRRASLAGLALLTAFLGYQLAGGWTHHAAFHDRDSIWSYEMSLPRPSMLAQASYASRLLRRAVEAEPGSALRRSLLESAVAAAKAGAAYQASIPWRNAPQYQPRERRRLAELFTVLGSAAELSGGPLEQQLELFRAAVRILPGPVETRDLARCLLTMAMREPRNASLARESLARYRQHVRGLRRDARKPSLIERDLRIYASDFPELAGDVRAIEAESLR